MTRPPHRAVEVEAATWHHGTVQPFKQVGFPHAGVIRPVAAATAHTS